MLGPWFKTDEEISVLARVTGPGPFSHTSHVTADNAARVAVESGDPAIPRDGQPRDEKRRARSEAVV
jgi:hypothetical protein